MSWLSKKVRKITGKTSALKIVGAILDPVTTGSAIATKGSLVAFGEKKDKLKPETPTQLTVETPDIDTAAKEAARAEADRIKKKKGYKSTIKTGALGLRTSPETFKTRLG